MTRILYNFSGIAFFSIFCLTGCGDCAPDGTAHSVLASVDSGDQWEQTENIKAYTPENLHELPGSATETYRQYGVETAATASYVKSGEDTVMVEFFAMPDALHAFGLYAMEQNPSGPFPDVGTMAGWSGATLCFYKGSCYAKIVAPDKSPKTRTAALDLARRIASVIDGSTELPEELEIFPIGGRIPNTVKYFPENTLGQEYFPNGFTTRYTVGNMDGQMFIALCGDGADNAYTAYKQLVEQIDGQPSAALDIGDEGFTGADPTYTNISACRVGSVVAGLRGNFDSSATRRLLTALVEKLRHLTVVIE